MPDTVEIHYRRLDGTVQLFRQIVVAETADYVVTFLSAAALKRPVRAGGRVVLEPGAPVVWVTYPGRWHDVGRFHLADGTFTGFYANVLTPVVMEGGRWETTDLALDVWLGADGAVEVLDRDELADALRSGRIDPAMAERAEEEAGMIEERARHGDWPPPEVLEWTLERARGVAAGAEHENGSPE